MSRCFYTEHDLLNAIKVLRANNARTIRVKTDLVMGQKYYKVEWDSREHGFDCNYWNLLFKRMEG